MSVTRNSHQINQEMSRQMHVEAADILRSKPELLEVARTRLLRWKMTTSSSSIPYIDEWLEIISDGPEKSIRMMLDRSDHGDVMRSCSPFSFLISERRHFEILRDFKGVEEKHHYNMLGRMKKIDPSIEYDQDTMSRIEQYSNCR